MAFAKNKRWLLIFAGISALPLGCSYSVPMAGRSRVTPSYATVKSVNAPPDVKVTAASRGGATSRQAASSSKVIPVSYQSASNYVTVQKGDTVYALARRHNVPIRSLIETNRLRPPFLLSPGQKLSLPPSSTHVVQKGETIYSISRKYSVDMSSLARQNSIPWPYSIYPGQALNLPGSIVAPKKQTVAAKQAAASKKTKTSAKSQKKTTQTKKKTTARKSNVRLPEPPSRSKGKFAWPLRGTIITKFGSAGAGRHNDGINIKVPEGTSVKAAENGIVAYAGNELKGFGNLLLVKHADGWMTAYAHNKEFLVKRGQTVKKGEVMAKAGKTGNAKEPQLHFEVRRGTKAVDPMLYLEK